MKKNDLLSQKVGDEGDRTDSLTSLNHYISSLRNFLHTPPKYPQIFL